MDERTADRRAPGQAQASLRTGSGLSMQGYLLVMVIAILLPAFLFATILFWRYYDSEIARIDLGLKTDARELSLDIDRDLQAKIVTLETLATSGSVNAHDYVRFYERALKLKALAGVDIALRDPDGQQLANTRVPWGAPLPRNPFQSDSNVLATKKPYVSDVIEGRLARQPVYFVSVPVIEGGAVTQLLHMTIDLSRLEAFVQGDIAAGQIAGVLDRNNIVMARTQDSTERIGKPASRDFVNQITGEEGTWLGRNIQGYTIRVGYERSKLSGWLIWVGVPDETIQSQLRQTLWTLSALGLALTILTIGAAYFFGGRLAAAAGALAAQAKALGRGDAMTAANIAVRELNDVGQELVAAGARRKELEQKLIAAATQESERRFQTIVQSVTDYAIFMLDPDGKVANWNAGARRVKGYSEAEIVGQHFSTFYTPEDRARDVPARALQAAARNGKYEAEGWRVRKDGSRFWASVLLDRITDGEGKLVGFAKITRDITERREAQQRLEAAREQLYQSQKMDAVGQLTGGVAHDFNNLLTIIIGNLDNAKRTLDNWQDGARARLTRAVEMALIGANRAATLTGHLLAFSRRQPLDPKPLDLNKVLSQVSALLRPSLGEEVQLETVGAAGIWTVETDAAQLETAIVNLAVNARDAMPNGGKLTIETGNVFLDEQYCADNAEVRPGQYVRIAVTDTGAGMSGEVLAHAFEPFFTTKQTGQGTGLGLSQVYGFVKQSGGHVKIYSEPGQGTTVNVYLPRAQDSKKTGERQIAVTPPPEAYGKETILVVEDDADVRALISGTLEELKYTVLQASDATSALQVLEREGRIDLLLTDVILPGRNGRELATAALEERPTLKVLFMTGYSRNAIVHQGRLDEGVQLIQKPLTQATLAAKVRDVLDMLPAATE